MTDRDDIIEELYSLEQSWRGGLPSRSVNWSAADEATNACADELADLIKELTEDAHLVQNDGRGAELGQEVGAVESVWMFRCAGSRDEWMPFVNEKHRLNTMRSPEWEVREFTSPAHTSEARDAALVDELVQASRALQMAKALTSLPLKNEFAKRNGMASHYEVEAWMLNAHRRFDAALAAMRQEAGSRE